MPVYYNYVFKVWGLSHTLPPLLLCIFSVIVLVLEFVVWWRCGVASLQSHICPPGGEESRCGDAWCQQREHTKPVGWCCFWSSRSEMYGTFHCHPCRRSTKLVAWTGWSRKGSSCQCRYLRFFVGFFFYASHKSDQVWAVEHCVLVRRNTIKAKRCPRSNKFSFFYYQLVSIQWHNIDQFGYLRFWDHQD